MELLRGQPAIRATADLLGQVAVPAVDVDPGAKRGETPLALCIAGPHQNLLIAFDGADELGALLTARDKPLAAEDAKPVHQALVRSWGQGPARWACMRLSALLLAGGRPRDLTLGGLSRDLQLDPPPDASLSFAAWAARVQTVAQLVNRLSPELKRQEMGWASRIEASAVAPIAEMELCGMPFDAALWQRLTREAFEERRTLSQRLATHLQTVQGPDLFGGSGVNLDSDATLKAALHALGHRVPDVRRQTLALLPPPLGPDLVRYRELFKLTSAYGDSFLAHVGLDGRIHPTFEQIGASTGRLSCHNPNLQAIVKGTPHRACFRTSAERTFVIGDYAACELRILADMSDDPVFAEAFAKNEDLHARVATEIFGVKVTKHEHVELRDRAKAINFGLAYGMGAGGLARATGTDVTQARDLLAKYFRTFPKIRAFLEHNAALGLARGYAHTLTGRRLYLDVGADNDSRAQAERIAKNMPIQGTSADITKLALAHLRQALLAHPDTLLVNTVHDEIVLECPLPKAPLIAELLRTHMSRAGAEILRHTPLSVDVVLSPTWDK